MRRVSVKDRILLHLSWYYDQTDETVQPFEITQNGIAQKVGVNRSHVAVNLGRLKDKGMIREQLSNVKSATRQRKIYHLTQKGLTYVNIMKNKLYKKTVMFRDLEGNVTEINLWDLTNYFYPMLHKYISYFEIINKLSESHEGIFDAKGFIQELDIEQKIYVDGTTKIEPNDTDETKPDSKPESESHHEKEVKVSKITSQGQHDSIKDPNQVSMTHSNPYISQYQSSYNPVHPYPFTYLKMLHYYYSGIRIPTHEERKKQILGDIKAFFAISIIFILWGSIFLLPSGQSTICLFFPFLSLGMLLAFFGFYKGFKRLAFIETQGRRLILTMGIFYTGLTILILELFLFSSFLILEIEILFWTILGMIGSLVLISKLNNLKTKYRSELTFIVGIFSILFGIFSIFIIPQDYLFNPFVFTPFWILFGITCLILGNELLGKIDKNLKWLKIEKHIITGIGIFIVSIILFRIIINDYRSDNLFLCYLSEALWLILGGYLLSSRFIKKEYSLKMLQSIKTSLPIGLGSIFLIFGIFLTQSSKPLEGLIEIAIGAVIISYVFIFGIKIGPSYERLNRLSFPIFVIITEMITFSVILIG